MTWRGVRVPRSYMVELPMSQLVVQCVTYAFIQAENFTTSIQYNVEVRKGDDQ